MPASTDYREAARTRLDTALGEHTIYTIRTLDGLGDVDTLPYSIKVLLESCLRHFDARVVTDDHLAALASYDARIIVDSYASGDGQGGKRTARTDIPARTTR